MKTRSIKTLARFIALAAFSVSVSAAPPAAAPAAPAGTPPPGHPPMSGGAMGGGGGMPPAHGGAGAADMSKADAPLTQKGKVVSVVDAQQFTYIEVQDAKGKPLWLASPAIAVKKGANIKYAAGEIMPKFHSKALNRDFNNVMFTTRVVIDK